MPGTISVYIPCKFKDILGARTLSPAQPLNGTFLHCNEIEKYFQQRKLAVLSEAYSLNDTQRITSAVSKNHREKQNKMK